MMRLMAWLAVLLALLGSIARAQPADTIFINGKVVTYDTPPAQALAVGGDRITAIGSSTDIGKLAGPQTRVIDLGGRTVIPGLIDSHIHAIRAGLTWQTEVNWIGVRTLAEAFDRIREKAKATPPGTWLVVAGGWTPAQFVEARAPTQAEMIAAALGHPFYVQWLYSRVLLSPNGAEALGLSQHEALAAQLKAERNQAGEATGWLSGNGRAITEIFDLLPRPTFEQEIAGTRAFFRELNRLGLTGVIDPGGYNLPIAGYQPLFRIWREHELTLRVRYSLCAPREGRELEDLKDLTQVLPMGFGDDWLRFNGIGENVVWGIYNNETPSPEDKDRLAEVLRWAASRGLTATFHWNNEGSVHHLLEVLERVNTETPIAKLRWSVAHLNDASQESLARMKAMGVGWLVQNAFYFRGQAFLLGQRGMQITQGAPAIVSALEMGLPLGGGTDAHRVMWPSPFVSLQWMLDGKTIEDIAMRAPNELPSRLQALQVFTEGSAWFAFDEGERGRLAPGKFADLVVLSDDYLTVPVERVGSITSVLTMVGGRVVYADAAFAAFEDRLPASRPR